MILKSCATAAWWATSTVVGLTPPGLAYKLVLSISKHEQKGPTTPAPPRATGEPARLLGVNGVGFDTEATLLTIPCPQGTDAQSAADEQDSKADLEAGQVWHQMASVTAQIELHRRANRQQLRLHASRTPLASHFHHSLVGHHTWSCETQRQQRLGSQDLRPDRRLASRTRSWRRQQWCATTPSWRWSHRLQSSMMTPWTREAHRRSTLTSRRRP